MAGGAHFRGLANFGERAREEQAADLDIGHTALEGGEIIEHAARGLAVERLREDGATDDIGRQMAHRRIERKPRTRLRHPVEMLFVEINRCQHWREGTVDAELRESRVHHLPLPTPRRAGGDKDRLTDEAFESANHQVVLRKDPLGVDHHALHQVGRIDDVNAAAGDAELVDPVAVGVIRQHADQVALATQDGAQQAFVRADRLRRGWAVERRHQLKRGMRKGNKRCTHRAVNRSMSRLSCTPVTRWPSSVVSSAERV